MKALKFLKILIQIFRTSIQNLEHAYVYLFKQQVLKNAGYSKNSHILFYLFNYMEKKLLFFQVHEI